MEEQQRSLFLSDMMTKSQTHIRKEEKFEKEK